MNIPFFKNVAEGTAAFFAIDDAVMLIKNQNDSPQRVEFKQEVHQNYIQFHFNIKGKACFLFSNGQYQVPLSAGKMLLLYNPQKELPLHYQAEAKSSVVSVLISIQKFHSLFSNEAEYIDFLKVENKDKKYYTENEISPSIMVVLHQMINANFQKNLQPLYLKSKIYELLTLYFNRSAETDFEQCPFLADEENILKIRKAKEIIIENMAEPPSLPELAHQVGLNIRKLKEGFKQIYGDSVYAFLFDYKMDLARKMLESNEFNVNEVSLKVGYSTPSHFISAFKKKYGTTPKKYLMHL